MNYTIKELVAYYKEHTQDEEYSDYKRQDRKNILVDMNYKEFLEYVIEGAIKAEAYDVVNASVEEYAEIRKVFQPNEKLSVFRYLDEYGNTLGKGEGAFFISSIETAEGIKYAFWRAKQKSFAARKCMVFDSEEGCVKKLIYQYGKTIGVGEELYKMLLEDEERNIQRFYDEKSKELEDGDFKVISEESDVTFSFIGNTYYLVYDQYGGYHKLMGPNVKEIYINCPSPTPMIETDSDYWPAVEAEIKQKILGKKWGQEYWDTHYIGKAPSDTYQNLVNEAKGKLVRFEDGIRFSHLIRPLVQEEVPSDDLDQMAKQVLAAMKISSKAMEQELGWNSFSMERVATQLNGEDYSEDADYQYVTKCLSENELSDFVKGTAVLGNILNERVFTFGIGTTDFCEAVSHKQFLERAKRLRDDLKKEEGVIVIGYSMYYSGYGAALKAAKPPVLEPIAMDASGYLYQYMEGAIWQFDSFQDIVKDLLEQYKVNQLLPGSCPLEVYPVNAKYYKDRKILNFRVYLG